MEPDGEKRWFAVRTVFKFGVKSDGTNLYEERIVGFTAQDADAAMEKAETESDEYVRGSSIGQIHDDVWSYEQDGDDLIDGYELWSQVFESDLSLDDFYAERYTKYNYNPE